jgi:hypothetical protein
MPEYSERGGALLQGNKQESVPYSVQTSTQGKHIFKESKKCLNQWNGR